ncbi:hypothetical protein VL20_1286 [Microcystis panniformis FACHB-1757]|uniref:Uncharacterized protein n=1 Tax=Microcystis panniformis FACHB-1757 TaxID=1638788 RepID=A0A0K1RXL6_9CHRO|nr:hypothetical protein VL20_1286 [Microcystis panniformis FACHB-1757]
MGVHINKARKNNLFFEVNNGNIIFGGIVEVMRLMLPSLISRLTKVNPSEVWGEKLSFSSRETGI